MCLENYTLYLYSSPSRISQQQTMISILVVIRLLLIINLYCHAENKFEFIHHINNNPYMSINANELTITSLILNPTIKHSSWIKSLFGSKSRFWYKTPNNEVDSPEKLSNTEKNTGKRLVNEFIRNKLPDYAYSSTCSIEILGFVKLNEQQPFYLNNKYKYPPTGYGQIHIYNNNELSKAYLYWTCSYRALYDNWRDGESSSTEPNYWPILLYCYPPQLKVIKESITKSNNKTKEDIIQRNSCVDLNNRFAKTMDSLSMKISIFLSSKGNTWISYVSIPKHQWFLNHSTTQQQQEEQQKQSYNQSFNESSIQSSLRKLTSLLPTTRIVSTLYQQTHYHHSPHSTIHNKKQQQHNIHEIAVCTCLPYETSDDMKLNSIGEIFKEFVRYYAKLNIKVIYIYKQYILYICILVDIIYMYISKLLV